jgi:c-di-GMP-binding flagellar brake protein YcgR
MSSARSPEPGPPPLAGGEVWLESPSGEAWSSVVIGVDADRIRLSPPRRGGRRIALPAGRPFELSYRVRDVPCTAPVVLEPPTGDELVAVLDGPPVRLQRRWAVRVPVAFEVGADGRAGSRWSWHAENLSAAGLLARAAEAIPPGTPLALTIPLEDGPLRVRAEVVRSAREDAGGRWLLGLRFEDLPKDADERLSRFACARQRQLRRRELALD